MTDQLDQWQQDTEQFGEWACLMWQWRNMAFNYEDAKSNDIIDEDIKTNGCRRKQSAALPFDLERAKTGDDVEFMVRGEWDAFDGSCCISVFHDDVQCNTDCNRPAHLIAEELLTSIPISRLRMKYPPRITS